MGRCKQLLPLGERPAISHCFSSIISAGIAEIVVVLGPGQEEIAAVVAGFPVAVVLNHDSDSDMSDSVRAGVRALSSKATGVIISLSDQPLVSAETYRILLKNHMTASQYILIPTYRGRRGHPALFPADVIKQLDSLPTLREVLRDNSEKVLTIATTDQGVVLDMDTPGDYQKVLSVYQDHSLLRTAGETHSYKEKLQ